MDGIMASGLDATNKCSGQSKGENNTQTTCFGELMNVRIAGLSVKTI